MEYDFDLFVIGGGSGGVRAGRMSAGVGKKVGIAESYRWGGTCVIRGCVPKKLFVYASKFEEEFKAAQGFGWQVGNAKFDWPTLIANKDREIARLEGLYKLGLDNAGAEMFDSHARLTGPHEIFLERLNKTVTAERILIAPGGSANRAPELPGNEHCITSEEAFHLEKLPDRMVIAGGGYIAVEFAGIFNGLGVDTTLVYRGEEILRGFDDDVRRLLHQEMEKKGIRVLCNAQFASIEKQDDETLKALMNDGSVIETNAIMLAIGRSPSTDNLGLEAANVEVDAGGYVKVNEYSRTSCPSIWAVGDVADRAQLTPVAIHEAMCFYRTEYLQDPQRPDHEFIATAVFSQPEIGTVGLSEAEAVAKYALVNIFMAEFRPMKNTLSGSDGRMMTKLVIDADSDKVVGAHVVGPDAGEMAQLLAISIKMGATKADFDRTMAVHPTAAEELVTMYSPSYQVKNGVRVD